MKNSKPKLEHISVLVTRLSVTKIQVTYFPDRLSRESEIVERGSYIGKLQRSSDELFDLLASNDEWAGEFVIERTRADGEYPIVEQPQ